MTITVCILWTIGVWLFGYLAGLAKGRGEAKKRTGFHIHKVEYPDDPADYWKKE